MSKYNRSEIAKAANAIFYSDKNRKAKVAYLKATTKEEKKATGFISQSESWTYAYFIADLKNELRNNVLFVRFQKTTGEVTERKATLRVEYINYESKGSTRKKNPLQIKYFETDSNCFKSFNVTRLKFYKAA